jgi:hypothetical protein
VALRRETKIENYVEAIRAWRALEQAVKDDGQTPERARAITQAKAAVYDARKVMTGGELGEAQRRLEGRTA